MEGKRSIDASTHMHASDTSTVSSSPILSFVLLELTIISLLQTYVERVCKILRDLELQYAKVCVYVIQGWVRRKDSCCFGYLAV